MAQAMAHELFGDVQVPLRRLPSGANWPIWASAALHVAVAAWLAPGIGQSTPSPPDLITVGIAFDLPTANAPASAGDNGALTAAPAATAATATTVDLAMAATTPDAAQPATAPVHTTSVLVISAALPTARASVPEKALAANDPTTAVDAATSSTIDGAPPPREATPTAVVTAAIDTVVASDAADAAAGTSSADAADAADAAKVADGADIENAATSTPTEITAANDAEAPKTVAAATVATATQPSDIGATTAAEIRAAVRPASPPSAGPSTFATAPAPGIRAEPAQPATASQPPGAGSSAPPSIQARRGAPGGAEPTRAHLAPHRSPPRRPPSLMAASANPRLAMPNRRIGGGPVAPQKNRPYAPRFDGARWVDAAALDGAQASRDLATGGIGAAARPAPSGKAPTPVQYAGGALHNPEPRYPPSARRRGIEGTVVLRVTVGPDGTARSVEVRLSSGYAILDQEARATVERWRFRPATRRGAQVAAIVDVPVRFRLRR